MKANGAKRVFLAALAVCFALLFVLFARRSVEGEAAFERKYPRNNMTLSLSRDKDGVIRVDGEGKLYAKDLKAMLKAAGIHSSEVKDVIVGDGISEIGYKTFFRMKYMQTLKLGASVARIAPGALNHCASLEWLYLPSGAEEIGAGFLYACDRCRVATDARPEALPRLENVDSERVLGGVNSLDALRSALDEDAVLPEALQCWWP